MGAASQSVKRRKLEEANIPISPNLEYVEADFEKESVRVVLERNSFNFDQPTFFSGLGVLRYLTGETVDAIFQFVASLPKASEIVFSFAKDNPNQPSIIERNTEAQGEPWLTKFQPDTLQQKLHGFGFSGIMFLTPELIAERYMQNRQDGLPVPRQASIVSAKV